MNRMKFNLSALLFLTLFAGMAFSQTTGNQVAKGPTSKASTPSVSKPTKLIDINTASKQALMALPGMSDAEAQKIIENRPYHAKTDLKQKKVLSSDAYEKIAGMVVAKTTTRVPVGSAERKAANSKGASEVKKKYQ